MWNWHFLRRKGIIVLVEGARRERIGKVPGLLAL